MSSSRNVGDASPHGLEKMEQLKLCQRHRMLTNAICSAVLRFQTSDHRLDIIIRFS